MVNNLVTLIKGGVMKRFILALVFTLFALSFKAVNVGDVVVSEKYSNGSVKKEYIVLSEGYKVTSYYENGSVSEIGYFDSNKKKTGEWISYFEEGKIKMKASFKNDKKDGKWEVYDSVGKLIILIDYKNNKRKFICTVDQNGGLIART